MFGFPPQTKKHTHTYTLFPVNRFYQTNPSKSQEQTSSLVFSGRLPFILPYLASTSSSHGQTMPNPSERNGLVLNTPHFWGVIEGTVWIFGMFVFFNTYWFSCACVIYILSKWLVTPMVCVVSPRFRRLAQWTTAQGTHFQWRTVLDKTFFHAGFP